jgi:hypothetical protein
MLRFSRFSPPSGVPIGADGTPACDDYYCCRPVRDANRGTCRYRAACRRILEREGLKIGFEISLEAQSFIQIRPQVVRRPAKLA